MHNLNITGSKCDGRWVAGDGIGGSEKRIGQTDTAGECEDLVIVKKSDANGATWDSINKDCYAEFGMSGHDNRTGTQTCQFLGQLMSFLSECIFC